MSEGKAYSRFYWASIAGAAPEPVEVTELEGRRVAYTCGCGDPFYLDEGDCPVRLGTPRNTGLSDGLSIGHSDPLDFLRPEPITRPHLANSAEVTVFEAMTIKAAMEHHSWRGPR